MKPRIKLLVVDDHPVVRRGIGLWLARQGIVMIVGEAADGNEALQKASELAPDIVLMDIDMPQMNGLAVTELLQKEHPKIKVLVLSAHNDEDYLSRVIQSGAHGYVLKESPPEELLRAIETVHAGDVYFSPEATRVAINRFVRGTGETPGAAYLTGRELEVLTQIAEGLTNKEIALHLGVGVRTVETHRERIMRKLVIHTVAGLTKFAIAKGLVSVAEERKR